MASYTEEFKKKVVRLHLEEGRSIRSLADEFNISKNGISYWIKKYREECTRNPAAQRQGLPVHFQRVREILRNEQY